MTDLTGTLVAAQVAELLQLSYDQFMYQHRRLVTVAGFPAPLPLLPGRRSKGGARAKGGRPPLRWSAEAVHEWIRNPSPTYANENAPASLRISAHDRDLLKARLG